MPKVMQSDFGNDSGDDADTDSRSNVGEPLTIQAPKINAGSGERSDSKFGAKKIVLVIDDDPDILELATSSLERLHDVRTVMASTAKEAVALLKRFPVDAILTDIQLPEMTGLQLLEHIRALGFATPFVLMSGHVDREKAIQATRLGVIDILEKPFSMSVLRESLVRALRVGSAIRRVHDDFKKFCDHRKLDPHYVDILSYMGIFLAQEEHRRFTEGELIANADTLAPIEPSTPEISHEFDAFTYTGVTDLSEMDADFVANSELNANANANANSEAKSVANLKLNSRRSLDINLDDLDEDEESELDIEFAKVG